VETPQRFGRSTRISRELWDRHRKPGLRVLVVEDDPDNAYSMALLLRSLGHTVATAADGETALQAAAVSPPDVVLLDIVLPGMDGCAVARRLREQQKATGHRMLLIAVTGHGQAAYRQRSWDAGVFMYLVKPVDASLLSRILASHARARQAPCGLWAPAYADSRVVADTWPVLPAWRGQTAPPTAVIAPAAPGAPTDRRPDSGRTTTAEPSRFGGRSPG
jgi:CheY-like chemotaxis protein